MSILAEWADKMPPAIGGVKNTHERRVSRLPERSSGQVSAGVQRRRSGAQRSPARIVVLDVGVAQRLLDVVLTARTARVDRLLFALRVGVNSPTWSDVEWV